MSGQGSRRLFHPTEPYRRTSIPEQRRRRRGNLSSVTFCSRRRCARAGHVERLSSPCKRVWHATPASAETTVQAGYGPTRIVAAEGPTGHGAPAGRRINPRAAHRGAPDYLSTTIGAPARTSRQVTELPSRLTEHRRSRPRPQPGVLVPGSGRLSIHRRQNRASTFVRSHPSHKSPKALRGKRTTMRKRCCNYYLDSRASPKPRLPRAGGPPEGSCPPHQAFFGPHGVASCK